MKTTLFLAAPLLAAATAARAQTPVDSALAAEIDRIPAIDNHAHPVRTPLPGFAPDSEYDALPADAMSQFALAARWAPTSDAWPRAWRDLFAYPYADADSAHAAVAQAARAREIAARGPAYASWVLDRLHIQTMLANRVVMGPGLAPERFRWVPFVDALVFPLSNASGKSLSPDHRGFYAGEEKLLRRYLRDAGVEHLPATLPEYLARVVTPTLERMSRDGAVAVKFEIAYLRSLDFGDPGEDEAAAVYARWAGGGDPPAGDYTRLQDYLFRYVAREAGRLHLPVHIHVLGGVGRYYRFREAEPLLLEPVLTDPALAETRFVIIHGGWPRADDVGYLIQKPNVYADFSNQTFFRSPHTLAETLRGWLEQFPDKVLFGTDAGPYGPPEGWEEVAWHSNTTARRALAMALTGMVRDGDVTRARALEIARMVLHDNAARLYGLPLLPPQR
ncbi:MAG TPA: amidohydrolase family protein [Longimicrobiaceae bacterium]|nr:amidohydrolase family protein [Longimicrobiaceae bacterium]